MATLLIATPFVHSTNALKSRALVADVRGCQAQKRLRISCRHASVSAIGEGQRAAFSDTASSRDEVTALPPSLSDWIVNFLLKEDVHEQAPQAVAAPGLQLSAPVAELEVPRLHQRERRQSERPAVVFTEEKARRLRKENRATQTFHDKWYHSAIASRLAIPE